MLEKFQQDNSKEKIDDSRNFLVQRDLDKITDEKTSSASRESRINAFKNMFVAGSKIDIYYNDNGIDKKKTISYEDFFDSKNMYLSAGMKYTVKKTDNVMGGYKGLELILDKDISGVIHNTQESLSSLSQEIQQSKVYLSHDDFLKQNPDISQSSIDSSESNMKENVINALSILTQEGRNQSNKQDYIQMLKEYFIPNAKINIWNKQGLMIINSDKLNFFIDSMNINKKYEIKNISFSYTTNESARGKHVTALVKSIELKEIN